MRPSAQPAHRFLVAALAASNARRRSASMFERKPTPLTDDQRAGRARHHELVIPGLRLTLLVIALAFLFFGAWLSAAARLEPDSAEVVASIFASTLNAGLRVIYVLGFGFLAVLLLYKQVIVFSFGASGENGFTSATVLGKLSGAILTGGFLGLGEALLPQTVIQRSASLIAAMTAR